MSKKYCSASLLLSLLRGRLAGGMSIGLILEGTVGRLYNHTAVEPFVPCIAITSLVLGLLVSNRIVPSAACELDMDDWPHLALR